MEWKAAHRRPKDFNTQITPGLIFCTADRYYTGYMNQQGDFLDGQSPQQIEGVIAWAFDPPDPISIGQGEVFQEWLKNDVPAGPYSRDFLIADSETDTLLLKGRESGYLDSSNYFLPEISHYIGLPVLPFRLKTREEADKMISKFIACALSKLGEKTIETDKFSHICLRNAALELANTSHQHEWETDRLKEAPLYRNLLSRWNYDVNRYLAQANQSSQPLTIGLVTVPRGAEEQQKVSDLLEKFNQAFRN